jgi:protein gp37
VQPAWIDKMLWSVELADWHFYMFLIKRPNLILKKFFHKGEFMGADKVLQYTAMDTSIAQEKYLWWGYPLLGQWAGNCFLSIEPLLSRLSIKSVLRHDQEGRMRQVIVGGESGKGARPVSPEWVRQLRDESLEVGRSCFLKQWGDGLCSPKYLREMGRTIDGRESNESPWPVPLPINADGHPCLSLGHST